MVQRFSLYALRTSLLVSALLIGLLAYADASFPLATPVFEQAPPNDTIVNCIRDIPMAIDLPANDGMGGATFMVSPVDMPDPMTIDPCTGGSFTRTWTATVGMMSAQVSQMITILPDMEAPVINFAPIMDTVACEFALPSAPSNPDRYDIWLNSIQVGLGTNVTDNCTPAPAITNDGGAPLIEPCATRTVTFTVDDGCGNTVDYVATYTTIDTIAPLLIGVPPGDTLMCTEAVPAPAMVTATDDCTPNLVPAFVEASTQIMDGSCQQYEYNILRTWLVSDSCGNSTVASQLIEVADSRPPSFDVPPNVTIPCDADPSDLLITGNATNAMDDCSPIVDVTFTDQITPGICEGEFTIVRLWRATDICGNVAGDLQVINVADLQPPSFNVPGDLTVDCSQADELTITGEPTNILDDCDPDPDVNFTDDIFPGSCDNEFVIRRRWRVTDRCGQFTELVQNITVEDMQDPVFLNEPQDLIVDCALDVDAPQLFLDWVENRAGATAEDNCTLEEDLEWFVFSSGSNLMPELMDLSCPASFGEVRGEDIDVIVRDQCGREVRRTVRFRVVDQVPPTLSNCQTDFSINTDPGLCTGTATLDPPIIEDGCTLGIRTELTAAQATLTSQAAPGEEGEVPVDPVTVSLMLTSPLPINADGPATLIVSLMNVDAESQEEFFFVYGEDGTLIGQTDNTADPCGDGATNFSLTPAQVNTWGADGQLDILLEPNIPTGMPGRFAINNNCPTPSTVQVGISYPSRIFGDFVFEYSIDGGARQAVAPIQSVDVTLDEGSHLIRYYATDCGGNIDSCSYTIMVEDNEAPVLNCPAPILVQVADDSCSSTLTLPLPPNATDNCGVFGIYQRTLPATPTASLIEFYLDPNLNDYLPQASTLSFNDVSANAFEDVQVVVDFQGDFNTNGAFFSILGDDGSTLLTSTVGDADCMNAGQLTTTIPANTFNMWAMDGLVELQIVPNDITVPPGVLGDGINPCDPMAVNNDGDTDGTSFILVSIAYGDLDLRYFAEGATTIAPQAVPSPAGLVQANFGIGETTFSYVANDLAGVTDTCSFTITVEDNTLPTAQCQPTNLFINPSGLQTEVVNPGDVDAGSTDNCMIDSLWLQPSVFTCDQLGQVVNVTLSVRDESGNIGTCQTIVGIAADGPVPTANSGLCGGDTLFLAANPPGDNPGLYLYQWFGPDGTALSPQSADPDLEIPGIDAEDEGPYRVEITGISGCTADGVVNVNIEALPLTPGLETASSVCTDDDILLSTPLVPAGTGVQFYWYEGMAPNGVLLGSSTEPNFTVAGPHAVGRRSFYMQVEANGCLSPSSEVQQVSTFIRPTATVSFTDSLVCAGETIMLGAADQLNATFSWTGPNTFMADQQFPTTPVLSAANGGYYFVRAARELCTSAPDSLLLNIKPRPDAPDITSNSPVCSGQDLVLSTTITGASTYVWEGPRGDFRLTTAPSLVIPDASESEEGQWRLRVVLNECESAPSDAINVVVNTTPTASAELMPNPACQGDDVLLGGFSSLPGSNFIWRGPGDYRSIVQSPTLDNVGPAQGGIYTLVVTSSAGCVDSTTQQLSILDDVSIVGVSDNAVPCLQIDENVEITPSVMPPDDGSYTYSWTFNGMEISTASILSLPNIGPDDAGIYTLEVRTTDGCSSGPFSHTLDLNFVPNRPDIPITVSGNLSFCAGETFTLVTSATAGSDVEYLWSTPAGNITTMDNTLTVENLDTGDDGVYEVEVIRNGCRSPISPERTIVVNPIPQLTLTSNSPVCEGDMINLQTTFYPSGTYNWSGPSGFMANVHNPIVANADSLMNSGTYRVFVENFGCLSDTISTDVLVRNRPQTPLVDHELPICLNDPDAVLTLLIDSSSALPDTRYTWYTNNGVTPVSSPSEELRFELIDFTPFLGGGSFGFSARAEQNGCESALSLPTTVQFDTIPSNTAFAGRDTTVCSGDFTMQAVAPSIGSGRWELVSAGDPTGFSIVNPDDANTLISGLSVDNAPYTLSWTISNGACQNYDVDEITINVINAELAVVGDDILVCADEIVNLEAQPASENSIGFWTQDTTQRATGVRIAEPGNPNSEVTGLIADNVYFFTWVVESACDTTFATILVNLSDPNIDAGPDLIVCEDLNNVVLDGRQPTFGSIAMWRSDDPAVAIADPRAPDTEVSNLQVGENLLIWEVDDGFCGEASRDTVIITYKIPPVLEDDSVVVPFAGIAMGAPLTNDQVPAGTSIIITRDPAGGKATLIDGQIIEYQAPPNFVGVYDLEYTTESAGCAPASAIVSFLIGGDATCVIPSIITPNNDGVNDNFVIPCLLDVDKFPNSQVLLFNSWGDEVYRSGQPYDSSWNGTYSGEDLPVGTYFYVVDLGDGSEPRSGYVMIQR